MKKQRPYNYTDLVMVARKVLLSMQVSRMDGLVFKDNELRSKQFSSLLYLYGGKAPRDLRTLLSFHYMHMLRKKWADKLHEYFVPFLPGLTKKEMWNIIRERRKHYLPDLKKRDKRREARNFHSNHVINEPKIYFYDIRNCLHVDQYPIVISSGNNKRIFPMLCNRYVEFLYNLSEKRIIENKNKYKMYAYYGTPSSYELNHLAIPGDVSKPELTLVRNNNSCQEIIENFTAAGLIYSWGYGCDFSIVFGKGKIFFQEVPQKRYVENKNYLPSKNKELRRRIEYGKKEEE